VIVAERAAQVPDNHDNTPIVFWERIAPIWLVVVIFAG
jgi:hypothetical protein